MDIFYQKIKCIQIIWYFIWKIWFLTLIIQKTKQNCPKILSDSRWFLILLSEKTKNQNNETETEPNFINNWMVPISIESENQKTNRTLVVWW